MTDEPKRGRGRPRKIRQEGEANPPRKRVGRPLKYESTGKKMADYCTGIRLALGMSQEQFAAALGVTHAAVCRWEKGVHGPNGSARLLMQKLVAEVAKK
jgi:DNA-binding transcriptional regulator YiaG